MKDLMEAPPPPWEERIPVYHVGPYSIEKLRTQWDYGLEGYYMAHCIGTKDADEFNVNHRVFSIRDTELGIPHATILTVLKGKHSPYGGCSDLGTHKTFVIDGERLRVLQVRGRQDDYAKPEFIRIAINWYKDNGGRLKIPAEVLLAYARKRGDSDNAYHFSYVLDEQVNKFNWFISHDAAIRAAAKGET